MGQAVFEVPIVSLTSRWTSTGTSHTTPSTVTAPTSTVVSGIPAGATDISAVLTYSTNSCLSGASIYQINGVNAVYSSTPHTMPILISGNGTVNFTFRFRANGNNTGNSSTLIFRLGNDQNPLPMTLTVTWTEPASTWTIPSSVALNSSLGLSITNSASGRRHTWNVSFGGASMGWKEISGTSASYKLPLSWASQIPNATSGTGTVHFRTCDSSLNVLTETSRSITVTLPSSVVPSAGALSVAVNNPYVYNSVQYCLQGIHTLTLTLSGYAGVYGSTIRSVFISGGGYSSNSRTLTTNPIQTSGNVTFTATVTDSRGRSASASVSRYVQPYAPVSIASAVARRADGNYAASDNGTNLYGSVTFVKTEVPGAGVTVIADYKTSTASAYASLTSSSFAYNNAARSCEIRQAGLLATDASYNVRYTVTDGITTTVYETIVPTASVYAVYDKDAKTVGFGAYPDTRSATNNFTVASDWSLYTHGSEILDLIKNQAGTLGYQTADQAYTQAINAIRDRVYPVGSIYMSATNPESPAAIWGGKWNRLDDLFLVGAGTSYAARTSGGQAEVALTAAQTPSVTGSITMHQAGVSTNVNGVSGCFSSGLTNNNTNRDGGTKRAGSVSIGVINFNNGGANQAHTNIPPYYAVYVWCRTE